MTEEQDCGHVYGVHYWDNGGGILVEREDSHTLALSLDFGNLDEVFIYCPLCGTKLTT